MKDATLCFVVQGDPVRKVLLGLKKAGFGQGKYDGFGGKIELGETPLIAALRELEEESGLRVAPEHARYMAHLTFVFPNKPDWSQIVHAFVATEWTGKPAETLEMVPTWFDLQDLPYARMWDDSAYWLARILAGGRLRARIVFRADNATVGHVVMEPLDEQAAARLAGRTEGDPCDWSWGRDRGDELRAVVLGLRRRFPRGDDPFQIMTCLLEEAGELAQQVNHFEDTGVKREKYGPPDRVRLANEVKGVLINALRLAQYYGIERELRAQVSASYARLVAEGYLQEGEEVVPHDPAGD